MNEKMSCEVYLKDRVDDQLAYYGNAANSAKWKYQWMQSLIIVFGLIVPVLVNLPTEWEFGGVRQDFSARIDLIVTVFSLAVAILTGLLNFKKFGELWLSYRMTEELIKRQKYLFLTRSGNYAGDNAFNEFVQTIETLISSEHNQFHALVQENNGKVEDDKTPV